jgi:hypothetical protein
LKRQKGFLVIPNNIEILKSNFIDKKESKIYSYEPNEFVVECEPVPLIEGDARRIRYK